MQWKARSYFIHERSQQPINIGPWLHRSSFLSRRRARMSRESDGHRLLRNSKSIFVGWTLHDVVGHNHGRWGLASRRQNQGQPELLPEPPRTLGLSSAFLRCADDIIGDRFPIGIMWRNILRLVAHARFLCLNCCGVLNMKSGIPDGLFIVACNTCQHFWFAVLSSYINMQLALEASWCFRICKQCRTGHLRPTV